MVTEIARITASLHDTFVTARHLYDVFVAFFLHAQCVRAGWMFDPDVDGIAAWGAGSV